MGGAASWEQVQWPQTVAPPTRRREEDHSFGSGVDRMMLNGRSQPLRDKVFNDQFRHEPDRPGSPGAPPSYFAITILDERELPDYDDDEPEIEYHHRHQRSSQEPTPRSSEPQNISANRSVSRDRMDAYANAGKMFARESMRDSVSPPRASNSHMSPSQSIANGTRLPPKPSMLVFDEVPADAWVSELEPVEPVEPVDEDEFKVVIDDEEEYRLYQEFRRRYKMEQEHIKKGDDPDEIAFAPPQSHHPQQNGFSRFDSWNSQQARFDSLMRQQPVRRRSDLIELQSDADGRYHDPYYRAYEHEHLVDDYQWNPAAMASPQHSPRNSEAGSQRSAQLRGPPGRRNVAMPTVMQQHQAREEQSRSRNGSQKTGAGGPGVMASSRKQLLNVPGASQRDVLMQRAPSGSRDLYVPPASRDVVAEDEGSGSRDLPLQMGAGSRDLPMLNEAPVAAKAQMKGERRTPSNGRSFTIEVQRLKKGAANLASMTSKQSKFASVQFASKKIPKGDLRPPMTWEESVRQDFIKALNDVEWIIRNDQLEVDATGADLSSPEPFQIQLDLYDTADAGPDRASADKLADIFASQATSRHSRLKKLAAENEEGPYEVLRAKEF